MTEPQFCPRCATPRNGLYQFCSKCAYDFGTGVAATPQAPTKSGSTMQRLMMILILAALGVAGVIAAGQLNLATSAPNAGATDTPPAGEMWFGRTFDTDTLALSGRIYSVGVNEGFAVVGRLPAAADGSKLNVRQYFGGSLVSTYPFNAEGHSDLWGWSANPLIAAGDWMFQLTDVGGNVLASGSITATE